MVTKNSCIDVFNSIIRETPISFQDEILPMVLEYLTEINYENFETVKNLIVQNPQLVQKFIPELIEYYCRKFYILRIQINPNLNQINFNLKTILYYE